MQVSDLAMLKEIMVKQNATFLNRPVSACMHADLCVPVYSTLQVHVWSSVWCCIATGGLVLLLPVHVCKSVYA